MDQQALQQKLAKAEAHVVECARQVAGQREELRRAGGDIETALSLVVEGSALTLREPADMIRHIHPSRPLATED